MRLISAKRFLEGSTDFFKEIQDNDIAPYAILSHTWEDEEISYQDALKMSEMPALKQRKGYFKIKDTCRQALEDRLPYVWIDTCCIDKSSSAELQEAINSMFRWYADSIVCYVFLSDGDTTGLPFRVLSRPTTYNGWAFYFKKCRWFSRAWTLQELLAPKHVYFHLCDWKRIGSLQDLVSFVSEATGIEAAVLLLAEPLSNMSVAKRMSWAAHRQATRIEDRAYSLLGIFDINMPLLYGEKEKAFMRLQEEIIKSSNDETVFAWSRKLNRSNDRDLSSHAPLLASSPADYRRAGNFVANNWRNGVNTFEMTNAGLRLSTFLIPLGCHGDKRRIDSDEDDSNANTKLDPDKLERTRHYAAVLNCRADNETNRALALRLESDDSEKTATGRGLYYMDDTLCGYCHADIQDSERLTYVDWASFPHLTSARMSDIIIARGHNEMYQNIHGNVDSLDSVLVFWRRPWTPAEVVKAQPMQLWTRDRRERPRRQNRMVLHLPQFDTGKSFVRGGPVLQTPKGETVNLVVEVVKHITGAYTCDAFLFDGAILSAIERDLANDSIIGTEWASQKTWEFVHGKLRVVVSERQAEGQRAFELQFIGGLSLTGHI